MMRFFAHCTTKKKKGFTLIEALVMVIIFSIMTLGFYQLYGMVMLSMIDAKKRVAAVEIANLELETLRNTQFQDIALVVTASTPTGSVAPGPIDYESIVVVGGNDYRVTREIYWIDDVEDDVDPVDTYANDYKNVIITVFWGNAINDPSITGSQVQLSSYYVPPSGNELGITEGIVSVNVVDDNGAVAGIYVGITDINGASFPNYTDSGVTESDGNIIFPSVPQSQKMYRITVGDGTDNYEIIETLPDYPTTPFYPLYTDISAVAGTLTSITIVNNEIPDLEFYSTDAFCGPIGNVSFDLKGGRILGIDTSGDPVYLNGSLSPISITTDAAGYYDMDSLAGFSESAGRYEVALNGTGYTLWRLLPGDYASRSATQVQPNTSFDCNLIMLDQSLDSVLVSVIDEDTDFPVEGAVVRLRNVGLGYSVNLTTDQYGTVYFPENENDVLTNGAEYDIRVTGDGYIDNQSLVTVTGLEEVSVTMQTIAP